MSENKGIRRIWVGAAVAVFAAGVVTREVIRSGHAGGDLLTHWWGQVALTAVAITTVATGMYLLNRAYRNRRAEQAEQGEPASHRMDPANPS
jgi:hypothetical protein